jgi:hypothetical protein
MMRSDLSSLEVPSISSQMKTSSTASKAEQTIAQCWYFCHLLLFSKREGQYSINPRTAISGLRSGYYPMLFILFSVFSRVRLGQSSLALTAKNLVEAAAL